eukprot:CAMPEP_0114518106 /NCGR_PEP_ID=MMETSP0109-20121206/18262_1 /TAXON_ID=29199 /ORGANISM="Chlorarachnion reptans, Strain CCCM449" /LENGTH=208 /DNA_ID=CAMNT_0001698695 /DNA_START=160 /DNA_END=786 /DNA_ORIENTATION=-
MSSCAGMPFILKGTYLDGKDKFPIDSEKLNVEIEYSIHTLHSIIKRHCKNIFPDLIKSEDRKKSIGDLLCIPTFQHCSCDMLEFTDPAEKEKDKLLKSFYAWCQNLCARLIEDGYWADYIDPCSGKPVLGEAGSSTYNEVEGMQLLLRYRYQQVGMCKVILHPKWGQRIYPASMFTNAPLDIISKAILAMEETFKAPATSGTKNEESK